MKSMMLALVFTAFAYHSNAQNLLSDGSFENLSDGYKGFVTITSGKVKGQSGKWQMVMAKGGCPTGCAKGTAAVVSTTSKSGKNSVEVKIDSQYNRNDIRLFQSITSVPPGVYEVSFYAKTTIASPIAIDVLKSTQQSTNNGAPPFTGSFVATTEWQQFKFTVDISEWTDEERNELRVSIRFNNSKALPEGPYPKTFWVDDVSIVKK